CVFVDFVCYVVASRPAYTAATCMEFFITLGSANTTAGNVLLLSQDVLNSFCVAALMCILSLVAVSTYTEWRAENVHIHHSWSSVCLYLFKHYACLKSFILFKTYSILVNTHCE
uniref:Uncharacterized protein n=1 Tax=Cyprinus carpio TaxID=7962 RepID=A0A8C1Y0R4_CYPCA